MKLTIPTELSEITVLQWQKYQTAIKESQEESFINLALVSIFCDIPVRDALTIPVAELKDTAAIIATTISNKPRFIQRFAIDGTEYGFIPNLDRMTASEYIDLDTYVSDPDSIANAMAVMFRKITDKSFTMYRIEDYNDTEAERPERVQAMLNAPIEVYLGAMVFFYNLSNDLLKATLHFIQQPTTEAQGEIADLQKNGVGISQYTRLLEETLRISRRQLG